MAQKRRVCLINYTHEALKQDVLSNISKVCKTLDLDISYHALIARLYRAKKRTGKQLVRVTDKQGRNITIEIREIE